MADAYADVCEEAMQEVHQEESDELLHLFAKITTTDHTELVHQFAYLLELEEATALFFLESSNWNLELAANNLFGTMGELRFESALQQTSSSRPVAPQARLLTNLSYLQTSAFRPRDRVTMTWVLENPGNVAWPQDTSLRFYDGKERFDAPMEMRVAATANSQIVVNVILTMPNAEGSFSGSWRLHSEQSGGFFGDPIWIACTVQDTTKNAPLFKLQEPHFKLPLSYSQSQSQSQSKSQQYLPASNVHLVVPSTAIGPGNYQEDQCMEMD